MACFLMENSILHKISQKTHFLWGNSSIKIFKHRLSFQFLGLISEHHMFRPVLKYIFFLMKQISFEKVLLIKIGRN